MSTATVLAVNDRPDQLQLLDTSLQFAGYQVLKATSAATALEIVGREHPQLIISDVAMPDMDGIELCRRLRQTAGLEDVPILLVSAMRKDTETAVEGINAGADDYLEAPYDPMKLIALVSRLVERQRSVQALREADRRAITQYEQLLERISSLAQVLGTARDLTTIYEALLDFTRKSVPCDALGITLYDPEKKERTPSFLWADGEEIDPEDAPPIPVNKGFAGRAITSGEIVISNDYQRELGGSRVVLLGSWEENRFPNSAMVVPMTNMGRTVGALEVQCYEAGAFLTEHATAMKMAANLAANSIENVRLMTREREREEQLRQSQKMEAIGRLAGGVAHDFNNVVTAIYGNCDIVMRDLESGNPLRQNISEIKRSARRAADLTRQLLAFSRKQVLKPVNLDLNALITDIDRMLGRLIGEDISVVCNLSPDLPQIKADKSQMEQIVMNLAVNSRDAMPDGGRIIIETAKIYLDRRHARTHPTVRPGWHVMLSVTDTGCGMSEEIKKFIFDPYFTTKEEGKGTGLGLATVYGIVKQSGGSIWVYSEVGHGTTFKIYLPVAEQGALHQEPSPEATDEHRGTETILVAEDDPAVREVIRDALEFSGYRVIEASSGREAIEAYDASEVRIPLVISDVLMPNMNGRELADTIRERDADVRVLFMSGYPSDAIGQHGVLDDGVLFIEKPFNNDELVRRVRAILDEQAAAEGAAGEAELSGQSVS